MRAMAAVALLVATDDDLANVIREALGPEGLCVRFGAIVPAVNRAFSTAFHLVVCAAPLAYGPGGFVTRIADFDEIAARRVVVIADPADARIERYAADRQRFMNALFLLPVSTEALARWVSDEWPPPDAPAEDVPPLSPPKLAEARKTKPLRVLVIDDDPTTASFVERARALQGFRIAYAADPWSAFDLATSDDFDVALCSAKLRMATGELVYRLVWNVRPSSKARFILVAGRGAVEAIPASTRRPRRLVERPLTEALLREIAEDHRARLR